MNACFYIDISKRPWIKNYYDHRLIELQSENKLRLEKANDNVVIVFSDFLPNESSFPDMIWELVHNGTHVLLILKEDRCYIDKCWSLLNKGISDIIIWEGTESLFRMIEILKKRWKTINGILESQLVKDNLVGDSNVWKRFLTDVIEAAIYSHSNICIYGESGTGKELVSRLIHHIDERKDKGKLVLVDCTTVVPELSGSEFFGHEKGSYTSSISSRDGAFALADKGTLFLDEISELPITLQAELLRVIQEKTYKRVGSNNWQSTDFRLVCATNKELKTLVNEGRFRHDLYYRITDIELRVPSLQQRSEDIDILARHFLKQYCDEKQIKNIPEFDPPVMAYIKSKTYPGNVRELKQFIRRLAMHHSGGSYITLGCIPANERPIEYESNDSSHILNEWETSIKKAIVSGKSLMNIKNIAAYLAIKIAIELENGNKQKAAKRLNLTVRAVQQHMKKNQVLT